MNGLEDAGFGQRWAHTREPSGRERGPAFRDLAGERRSPHRRGYTGLALDRGAQRSEVRLVGQDLWRDALAPADELDADRARIQDL